MTEYSRLGGHITHDEDIGDWAFTGAFSPKGYELLVANERGAGAIWDMHEKRIVRTGSGMSRIDDGTFADRIAVMGPDIVYLLSDPPELRVKLPRTSGNGTRFSALSPDGVYVVSTVTADAIARIWDVKTGRRAATLEVVDTGPKKAVRSAAFRPRRGARRVATANRDGTIRFWDLHDRTISPPPPDDRLSAAAMLGDACALLRNRPVLATVEQSCTAVAEQPHTGLSDAPD